MKRIGSRLLCILLLLSLLLSLTACGKPETQLEKTACYLQAQVAEPGAGSIGGDWLIFGLARSGVKVSQKYFDTYYKNVEAAVREKNGILSERKYTEYSRTVLALTAIGKDPASVAGFNLLRPLADFEQVAKQGINGTIFALLALDSGNYEIPENPDAAVQATRQMYVDEILDRQLDDGGWNLTLALACPAFRWPFGGKLDKAVFNRATSIYLPEATHHMLPEALGTGAYSLLAQKTRPSLLIECTVGADGLVAACEPRVGYARLAANLCYEDCETALDGGESPASPYLEQLRQALELARAHQERRIEKGAVIIERPDITINLEGAGESITVSLDEDPLAPKAHLLVSELMVLTNAALAAWAKEHGVTLLHRTQDVAIPKEFSGIWQTPLEIARVVKALAPAVLETNPRPHAGLGEAMYAPSTSPLRRYPDMINETQIISLLRDGKPRWSKEELDTLLPLLNAHLDAAGQVQRFRPRYWKLLYFKQQGDRWWPAVITDENDAFVTVNMPKEQMIVRARRQFFGERTHPGQELEIRLGKVHPLQNDFQLLETREI